LCSLSWAGRPPRSRCTQDRRLSRRLWRDKRNGFLFPCSAARACKRQPVFQINVVTLAEAKGKIEVQVEAVADTALWIDPALVARQGSRPRTLEFDFVACPPGGFVVQVLAPIAGRQLIEAAPRDIDTIIVHSRTNSMTARVKDFLR
jgi:hypothetical protein